MSEGERRRGRVSVVVGGTGVGKTTVSGTHLAHLKVHNIDVSRRKALKERKKRTKTERPTYQGTVDAVWNASYERAKHEEGYAWEENLAGDEALRQLVDLDAIHERDIVMYGIVLSTHERYEKQFKERCEKNGVYYDDEALENNTRRRFLSLMMLGLGMRHTLATILLEPQRKDHEVLTPRTLGQYSHRANQLTLYHSKEETYETVDYMLQFVNASAPQIERLNQDPRIEIVFAGAPQGLRQALERND